MRKILSLFILTSLLSSLLFGCARDPEKKSKTYYGLFGTVTTVYDYSGCSAEDFAILADSVHERLAYYDAMFDIYESHKDEGYSGVYEINAAAGEAVTVPLALIEFLEFAIEMHNLTDGNVNIAMGAVTRLWHDAREAANRPNNPIISLPESAALTAAAEHTDIGCIEINRESLTVRLTDPEARLDVGAIAKGYAAERVAEELTREGYSGIILDVGGNLRAVGSKPSGKGWQTGVKNPEPTADKPYVYTFEIKNASAVTSGDYERYYTVGGVRYHHIINKDTLMPKNDYRSVTVVTEDSGLADALSTALFNMDYEDGVRLIESIDSAFAVWVMPDGRIFLHGDTP